MGAARRRTERTRIRHRPICSDHDEQDSWKLVHFIRHLPQLTAEEQQEMEKLNPKSPDELKEEEEEEKFLKGQDQHETHIEHHHH